MSLTGMMEPQRNNNTAISRCGCCGILWLDLASLLLPHSYILVCASTHTPSMLALTGTLFVCSALPLPTPHTHT
ncbi:hypothetical protein Pelo_3946 [Pelomyxa schiedti]|nr:hypothetical protein Pelo_3946 [Pelomyxa schiedti]